MKCPNCGSYQDKVVDTRTQDDESIVKRRRECLSCGHRYSTSEKIDDLKLMVVKKDGSKELFDSQKILGGLYAAASKRPISNAMLMQLVGEVERLARSSRHYEISTSKIGEVLMARLKELDKVAYVRFASVYRDFTDVESFTDEIDKIRDTKQ